MRKYTGLIFLGLFFFIHSIYGQIDSTLQEEEGYDTVFVEEEPVVLIDKVVVTPPSSKSKILLEFFTLPYYTFYNFSDVCPECKTFYNDTLKGSVNQRLNYQTGLNLSWLRNKLYIGIGITHNKSRSQFQYNEIENKNIVRELGVVLSGGYIVRTKTIVDVVFNLGVAGSRVYNGNILHFRVDQPVPEVTDKTGEVFSQNNLRGLAGIKVLIQPLQGIGFVIEPCYFASLLSEMHNKAYYTLYKHNAGLKLGAYYAF